MTNGYMISDLDAFIIALLEMDDFSIIMVLRRIYTGSEHFLLLGWICGRKGMKADVGLIPPFGIVWWDGVVFCIPSCAKLLVEHTLCFLVPERVDA